jgi:2-methylaconitate cis-trans-isomerase PrpF
MGTVTALSKGADLSLFFLNVASAAGSRLFPTGKADGHCQNTPHQGARIAYHRAKDGTRLSYPSD